MLNKLRPELLRFFFFLQEYTKAAVNARHGSVSEALVSAAPVVKTPAKKRKVRRKKRTPARLSFFAVVREAVRTASHGAQLFPLLVPFLA